MAYNKHTQQTVTCTQYSFLVFNYSSLCYRKKPLRVTGVGFLESGCMPVTEPSMDRHSKHWLRPRISHRSQHWLIRREGKLDPSWQVHDTSTTRCSQRRQTLTRYRQLGHSTALCHLTSD